MINPVTISQALDKLLTDTANPDISVEQAKAEFIQQMTQAIVDAIKSATIILPPSSVIVVGGPTSQTNVIPLVINNALK